jgi:type IV pilus assembly protein PilE
MIELLIAVAIIGILASVAYPAYQGYIREARRSDAKVKLSAMMNELERYSSSNSTYIGFAPATPYDTVYYLFTVAAATDLTFTIQAVPQGSQSIDGCGTLTLDQSGQGTPANCW